ncbi:hypothetical protein LOD99_2515 [Oopsacas minuta]|uniref:Ubiquitin-related modifier 1 homolog n=1 Tax=Oopsacas minuta TaxID=111878 RepID=A0AAV7K234_9METZ|nr:hypothetical protein LOD99_2515 [Oopsacas minuta]
MTDGDANLAGDGLNIELSVWLQHLSMENTSNKEATKQLVDLFGRFNIPAEFVNLLIITASNGSLHEYLRNLSSLIERTLKHAHVTQRSGQDVLPPIPLEEGERNELEELISPQTTDTLFNTESNNLFEHTRTQVNEALRELMVITTHDDNLERQYKEMCAQCSKLFSDLDRAKREVFKLRGKISIVEMTPERMRIEMNKQKERDMKKAQQVDRDLHESRTDELAQVLNERPIRKNAPRLPIPAPIPVTRIPKKRARHTDIPPPVEGCQCSVCKTVQGLGSSMIVPVGIESIQSGQQILLGDRVIVKGQRPGTVRYLGKLEDHKNDLGNEVFAGVQLDYPVGVHNGTFNGKRYFSCPAKHGVFLPLRDVICVSNRAVVPLSTSLALKRAKKRQEAEEKAKKQLIEQERAYQSGIKYLNEIEQKRYSMDNINVLSLETPLTSYKKLEKKISLDSGKLIQSTDFSKTTPDKEKLEMRNRMDNLLLKSRSIYDEKHPSHVISSREMQPESLSRYGRPDGTGGQGRRECMAAVVELLSLDVTIEFNGGAELLFGKKRRHQISLPQTGNSWTIQRLLFWLRDNILTSRPDLFIQNDTVRPGILVLVNNTDWELLDGLNYQLQQNDVIVFISTLHGG